MPGSSALAHSKTLSQDERHAVLSLCRRTGVGAANVTSCYTGCRRQWEKHRSTAVSMGSAVQLAKARTPILLRNDFAWTLSSCERVCARKLSLALALSSPELTSHSHEGSLADCPCGGNRPV